MLRKVYAALAPTGGIVNPFEDRFPYPDAAFGLVMNVVIGSGIALSVVFFVLSGIKYMTSQGDPKATDDAKKSLTYAVVGFILVLAAITTKTLVGNILASGAGNYGISNVSP